MPERALAVVEQSGELSAQDLMNVAFDFASAATSKNTQRTYSHGWKSFTEWCAFQCIDPMATANKEAVIAFYIADKASNGDLKIASISCYLAAIRSGYLDRGSIVNMQHPSIVKVLKGVRRKLPARQTRKEPVLTEDLQKMIQYIQVEKNGKQHLAGIRDRALLLIGFAGAFRRSELAAIMVEDLTFSKEGVIALVRKSKTDQEGEGLEKKILYGDIVDTCPVKALLAWLEASQTTTGPIFRGIDRHGNISGEKITGEAIALIIKKNKHIEEEREKYSGHSLRAGFVTQAVINEVPEDLIMLQTGHKSRDTLTRYIRRGRGFKDSAAGKLGL